MRFDAIRDEMRCDETREVVESNWWLCVSGCWPLWRPGPVSQVRLKRLNNISGLVRLAVDEDEKEEEEAKLFLKIPRSNVDVVVAVVPSSAFIVLGQPLRLTVSGDVDVVGSGGGGGCG